MVGQLANAAGLPMPKVAVAPTPRPTRSRPAAGPSAPSSPSPKGCSGSSSRASRTEPVATSLSIVNQVANLRGSGASLANLCSTHPPTEARDERLLAREL